MAEHLQHQGPPAFLPEIPSDGPRGAPWLGDRIRLHDSVLEGLKGRPAVSKRLAIAVQQLAALGRTTIVKGCSDTANRGWRRTPLGGHGGMHFYLWWTPQGSPQTKEIEGLARRAILVRAIRHHDNHKVLRPGTLRNYHELSATDIAADSSDTFESPWTATQQSFMRADTPVRVVRGYPGSGKTMALWKAVEARGGRTLYLTWSSALIEASRSRFEAFTSPDSQVDPREFSVFVGSLCKRDINKLTLDKSRENFRKAFDWWKIRDHLGPWRNNLIALHAELRAVLFGRAVPGLTDCTEDGLRLSDEYYLENSQVGDEAASALLEAIKRSGWPSWHESVFPEVAAASTALKRIRAGHLRAAMQAYDRVVVDEVQDLSLVEAAVVTGYCEALATQRLHAPRLMMAFDDGQTVRPSGFASNRLSNLLGGTLVKPEEFFLDHNVRSPSLISDVVHRASNLYRLIDKNWRPKDQLSKQVGQEIVSRLIYVPLPDRDEGRKLMRALEDVDDVAVVSPRETVPDWLPPESREMVHTPEKVKGLEYASACVLDVGKLLKQLRSATEADTQLEIQARRTAIDGLRVAVSRATENLIFIDLQPDQVEKRHSLDLLKEFEEFTGGDLTEFFSDADLPLDERIQVRTRDALSLVDAAPERAWQRACQALRLLGALDAGTLDSDESLRREVCASVLQIAARRMVSARLAAHERQAIAETTKQVTSAWGSSTQRRAFASFSHWIAGRAKAPFALLNSTLALAKDDRKWLQSALPVRSQALLEDLHRCASDSAWAVRYAGDVEIWLDLIGFTGDMAAKAEELRQTATDRLVRAKKWKDADRVLSRLGSPDPRLAGTILERVGRRSEAAEAFERAGLPRDALRNWRHSGRLDRAVPLADGEEKADLKWLLDVEGLIAQRPPHVEDRLSGAEKRRLNQVLQSARTPIRRRRGKANGQGSLFRQP